jgi:hypothetical protein
MNKPSVLSVQCYYKQLTIKQYNLLNIFVKVVLQYGTKQRKAILIAAQSQLIEKLYYFRPSAETTETYVFV